MQRSLFISQTCYFDTIKQAIYDMHNLIRSIAASVKAEVFFTIAVYRELEKEKKLNK